MDREYYVYLLSSEDNKYVYTGMTNDIHRRMFEHKNFLKPRSYSATHKTTKLVYLEVGEYVMDVAAREKQIKKWRREKKNYLINLQNPEWKDYAADWGIRILDFKERNRQIKIYRETGVEYYDGDYFMEKYGDE